jgi:CDP-paratose 2-epimerase
MRGSAFARPGEGSAVDDFGVNVSSTSNLLETARRHGPEAPFIFMNINRVYGDTPHELPLVELPS